jgi:DNA-binding GntR family transcriptional regulator
VVHRVSTRSQAAFREVKRRIMQLELAPGAHFTEGELATELGLSKTPLREALACLQNDGLVDAVARSGYRVTPITLKDARDLFALRTVLEGEAAALAAARRSNVEALRGLDQLCHTGYDANDRASISSFLGTNAEFHVTLARAGGNDRLADMLEYVIEQLERFFQLALTLNVRADEMVHEHCDLLAAVTAGNAEQARAAAVAQARTAQQMVFEALLDSEAVQLANLGDLTDAGCP